MRWLFSIFLALLLGGALYFGSAYMALSGLVDAARQADGDRLQAHTDVAMLKRSITEQVVIAYLKRIAETRKPSSTERLLAQTVGGAIADALVSYALTPQGLAQVLKEGRLSAGANAPPLTGLPRLSNLDYNRIRNLLGRLHLITPVEMSIRIDESSNPDERAAIRLHLDGAGWRLSGMELPPRILRDLAARLPSR